MRVNELQIGDYVNYRGQIIKVTSLYDKGGSNEVGWSDKESVWVNGRTIEPIPLAKIHLAKNGFEAINEYDTEFVYGDGGFEVKVEFDEGLEVANIPPCIYLRIEFAEKELVMPIEYVHELQHAMRIFGISKSIEV